MKNWKKYTFYVSVIIIGFLIGWFTDDSESENPVVEEKVVQLTYKDYEECRVDINCWKTVWDNFLYTVLTDAEDGVIDGDYYLDRVRIFRASDKITDELLKGEIGMYFNSQLRERVYKSKYREAVLDELGLVMN